MNIDVFRRKAEEMAPLLKRARELGVPRAVTDRLTLTRAFEGLTS